MTDLEKVQTPEHRELAAKQAEFGALETELVDRELDLSTLQQELASFQAEYYRVVGTRYAELDELKAKIAEAQAAQRPDDTDAQQAARAAREAADRSAGQVRDTAVDLPVTPFTPSPSLKTLYRTLARTLHPDLAGTDDERRRRHEWMVKVNEAYKQGDEASLQALQAEWAASPDAVAGDGVGSDLVRVIRQIAQVKRRIDDIGREIETLKANELFGVRAKCETAREAGRDMLEELAAQLDSQIADATQALASILGSAEAGVVGERRAEEPADEPAPAKSGTSGASFIVVDVETATSNSGSICQIGVVTVVDGVCVDRWSSLVNPDVPFEDVNVSLHGITEAAVRRAPRLPDLLPDLRRRFAGQIVGCHTMFDRHAFTAACRRYGVADLDARWLDTAEVVRGAWTQFARKGYKLDNIADHLGITFQHHDALDDAHVAAQVLLRAIEKTGVSVEGWYARTR